MKRKTSITKIASILTVLAMVWGGVACQQQTEPEPTKYTITFDSGVESITVEEGAAATKPTDPEKTGYSFGGWFNGDAEYAWTQPVTSNLSLTAKWTATVYTITYRPDGVETDNPPTYTIETDTFALADPKNAPDATKPNFVAWHVDSEEGAVVTEVAKGSTENKTFYAEFSAEVPCVVKFMSGTTEVKSIKVKKDTKITLPTGFEKYSLFSDADCTKAFDTNTAITEDTTIYVKLKTFTISYKVLPFDNVNPVEGKTNGSMPVEYGKVFTDEEINAFAEEINGYTYKGVFTDEACTVLFDNTNAITSDLTVYVLYEEVVEGTPEITYDEVTVDGNTTTILRPTMETAWGATVKGNVISFSGNSAAKWTYENIKEYSIVELFYETTKTENAKLSIKSSDGDASHSDLGYPDLSATGSLKYNIADFVTKNSNFSHIVLANNANNNDWSNNGANIKWDDDWSVTITKIVLTKVEKLEDKVIFDPASFTAPEGMEIVEKDGVKYLKVTPNGYKTSIELAAPVDISGYTHYTYDFYNDEAAEDWQVVIALKNYSEGVSEDDQSVGNGTDVSSTEVKTVTSAIIKDSTVTALQPFAQSKTDWQALTDKVVYFGKITAITK